MGRGWARWLHGEGLVGHFSLSVACTRLHSLKAPTIPVSRNSPPLQVPASQTYHNCCQMLILLTQCIEMVMRGITPKVSGALGCHE